MNQYNQIVALVPAGEHFDAAAINEGIYLTAGHVAAIETALLNHAGALTEKDNLLQAAADALQTAAATHAAELQPLQAASGALATANETITALEAQVAELKAKAAGGFTAVAASGDDAHGEGGEKNSYTDPNNALNAFADRHLGTKK